MTINEIQRRLLFYTCGDWSKDCPSGVHGHRGFNEDGEWGKGNEFFHARCGQCGTNITASEILADGAMAGLDGYYHKWASAYKQDDGTVLCCACLGVDIKEYHSHDAVPYEIPFQEIENYRTAKE